MSSINFGREFNILLKATATHTSLTLLDIMFCGWTYKLLSKARDFAIHNSSGVIVVESIVVSISCEELFARVASPVESWFRNRL